MRLFVAVNFPESVRHRIQSALNDFPVADPPWRWTSPDNWHLTLKFLGDTTPEQAQRVIAALDSVRKNHDAFDMTLGAFGGFPNLRHPRSLFYNVERGGAELERLAHDVDTAIEQAIGLPTEKRAFHPHATVARVKESLTPAVTARLAQAPRLTQAVTRVVSFELMESRLQRTGARYSVVKEFALS